MIWTVHVEVRLSTTAKRRVDTVRNAVLEYISSFDHISLPSTIQGWEQVPTLAGCVERITVSESSCPLSSLPVAETSLQIHTYQPIESDIAEEYSNGSDGRDGSEEVLAASVCELPSKHWDGLWDSLIYADNIKLKLLDYIYATLLLSDADIDSNMVSWNRVVLLHGPPGTGKTSLCRALAQKLSIRLSHRYSQSRLLEINSHSLFSRWFSESGKLVQRLFSNITDMVEDEDCFVVVLIDEVESLTAARAGAMAGTEPSDGLRVVNALLTQLDKLKHKKNVLVMSTSNLVKAIDSAFVDRADIIQYVDLPPREAIYEILRGSLCEFMSKGLVHATEVPPLSEAKHYEANDKYERLSALQAPIVEYEQLPDAHAERKNVGLQLLMLASKCREQGLSGRALRRLPVMALARYIGVGGHPSLTKGFTASGKLNKPNGSRLLDGPSMDIGAWLDSIESVVSDRAVQYEKLI
ncbi:hypothetical protein SERLA73DRAFT_70918 [Serpula lacrymans var. lacrymans S7.3]|uniref:AAA+ ATPase domain-containing protein n=2 Tax=Serpula lacrymans var. lacrymans TaxID=341189 RepID=F8PNM4_SERL3|nr:uncharacterized protein SERLADRAFT_406506 [Serpula lacrymans var. lacrymans S7.9]EGO01751.1 hypothetical protein SERLA73DRAFT_70918 [Serpula lacrymans var. lacrymans S7.3]EGO27388.1 hypothetical protein SERLADRAFT_406506 [Serpula lacrymans var. lacrymans S7.9]